MFELNKHKIKEFFLIQTCNIHVLVYASGKDSKECETMHVQKEKNQRKDIYIYICVGVDCIFCDTSGI